MTDRNSWTEVATVKSRQRNGRKQNQSRKPHAYGGASGSKKHTPKTKLGGKAGKVLESAGAALPTRRPVVIVLVGMPGSGKSTFCEALSSHLETQRVAAGLTNPQETGHWGGPVRVSQDDLGGRKPCIMLVTPYVNNGAIGSTCFSCNDISLWNDLF
eukprot:SAG31_NODE_9766_length_1230_cov_1.619805_1_plen_157_part_00